MANIGSSSVCPPRKRNVKQRIKQGNSKRHIGRQSGAADVYLVEKLRSARDHRRECAETIESLSDSVDLSEPVMFDELSADLLGKAIVKKAMALQGRRAWTDEVVLLGDQGVSSEVCLFLPSLKKLCRRVGSVTVYVTSAETGKCLTAHVRQYMSCHERSRRCCGHTCFSARPRRLSRMLRACCITVARQRPQGIPLRSRRYAPDF